MEEFEIMGSWWIPDYPDHAIVGKLKFHPANNTTLELIGSNFSSEIRELFGSPQKRSDAVDFYVLPDVIVFDILLGYSNDGKAFTLCKCQHFTVNDVFAPSEIYYVDTVFSGWHFHEDADIVFEKILIEYTHLEAWIEVSGFRVATNNESEYTLSLSYITPEPVEIQINDNLKIIIRYSLSWQEQYRVTDFHAKQTPIIEIIPSVPMHYNEYHSKAIYHLRNFLSLGMGTPILPTSVKGVIKDSETESAGGERKTQIDVFYQANGSEIDEAKRQMPFNMLFYYRHVADDLQKYLQIWFAKAERLDPVMDQYFGLFYIPAMYIHLEFLTLVQALETYHRRMYGGQYMSPIDYEPVRQFLESNIPATLTSSHRNSLEGRIKWGYEYSLQKRLTLILDEVLAPYKQIVDNLTKDRKTFVKRLKDTRNYLTHYSEDQGAEPILEPNDQYVFVQRMKLIIQLCFLVEMEFPSETIKDIVQHNSKFQYWSHRR